MFLGHAQMHCRQGSFFVAEEFTIKNACEKALENINKARQKKFSEAVINVWLRFKVERESWRFNLLALIGLMDYHREIKTVEDLLKNTDLLKKLAREQIGLGLMTSLDWADLYAVEAKDACERLLAACAVSKQLYVDAEEWASVYQWYKKSEA